MKSIVTKAIIEGIRARKDGSLGLTVTTPELAVQEKALFMELQGINVDLTITPFEAEEAPEYRVDADLKQKSQSQRIRSVLYILYTQNPENITTFEEFYRVKTEKYIEMLKSKIED